MDLVLAITPAEAPEYLKVRELLEQRGILLEAFDGSKFMEDWGASFVCDSAQSALTLAHRQNVLNMDSIRTVWYRKIPQVAPSLGLYPRERLHSIQESHRLIHYLEWSLQDKIWLGRPWHMSRYDNKLIQLELAVQAGFRVPRTVAGNNPKPLGNLFQQATRIIVKPLWTSLLDLPCDEIVALVNQHIVALLHGPLESSPSDSTLKKVAEYTSMLPHVLRGGIPTLEFNPLTIKVNMADRMQKTPLIFQESIPAHRDIRVTVIDHEIFACSIRRPDFEEDKEGFTVCDWRPGNYKDLEYEVIEIPQNLRRSIFNYMKYLQIEYAAFDFVLNQADEYIFLESNLYGAWAWIEDLTGLPISHALSSALEKRVKSSEP